MTSAHPLLRRSTRISAKLIALLTSGGVLQRFVNTASAQITNPALPDIEYNEELTSGAVFTDYFILFWQSLISVGGIAVLIYFLWGAVDWITAGGDSGKITSARNKITQSFIGMAILALSFLLVAIIDQLFFGAEFSILNLQFRGIGSSSGGSTP